MRNYLTILLFVLTTSCFSQGIVIYILDSIPSNDTLLNRKLDKRHIVLKSGSPKDIIEHNYKTIDSLKKVNRSWLRDLDKDLSKSVVWQRIKKNNTNAHRFNKGYYEYVSFWDFGRIKNYQFRSVGTGGDRNEVVLYEVSYGRDGKIKD